MIKVSAFNIKILAAVFMVMDHVCYLLIPELRILHLVGRFSFPLFAWLLAEGEKHTQNVYRYGRRLLITAIISQPIYSIVFQSLALNILFTLFLGLVMLRLIKRYSQLWQQLIIIGLCAVVAEGLGVEYRVYGIAVILLMSLIDKLKPNVWLLYWCFFHFILVTLFISDIVQYWAIIAGFIVFQFNGKQGSRARWFYVFYPAHLIILGIINYLIQSR
ncbi:MAG: TraX family protein [Nostoc sp. DedQUE08]|uniref:TraX family protein n=1 Tax=unclassified Nostoc TaxID=2593658 RepID=UPI002AD1D0CA|nr:MULTISPECIES: TraX family protein [unclassified Nostoc]MDZ8035671.1 TraX family protein [Nostoc sp. DedSLP04]MDZ8069616.1 TraX family protein [Nostoc sp. DedQUE08]